MDLTTPGAPLLTKSLRIALDAKDPMHHATDYLSPSATLRSCAPRPPSSPAHSAQRMLPPN
jgi:hypothetical protein